MGKDFLNRTSSAREIMPTVNKWNIMKFKNFYTAKGTELRNILLSEWEKNIFLLCIKIED